MQAPMHRLFVAIDLPEEIKRVFQEYLPKAHCPQGYRWRPTRPEQLHLTLKFLGLVENSRIPELASKLAQVAESASPFELALSTRLSRFRAPHGGCVLWMGFRDEPRIGHLATSLERSLAPLGYPFEKRSFTPHLTLARGKKAKSKESHSENQETLDSVLAPHQSLLTSSWPVRDFVLYESFTNKDGALYRERRRFPFRGDSGRNPEEDSIRERTPKK